MPKEDDNNCDELHFDEWWADLSRDEREELLGEVFIEEFSAKLDRICQAQRN